jgi:hypothetical protein
MSGAVSQAASAGFASQRRSLLRELLSSPAGRRLAGATGSGLGRLQKQESLSGRATMERPRERAAGRDRRIRSRFARLVANCPQLARGGEQRPPRFRRDERD